jgi:glutaminyl-tRNA synthetase
MRDPVMYRILHVAHDRTGERWSIYPSYDWAHGQSDSIEGITHSLCTLEFEDHRPLYDWFLDQLGVHHPRQIEFARVNVSHTITSKRKLGQLVSEGHVEGWDDPRMPTLAGLRRRGVPPEALRAFLDDIGVSKRERIVEMARLEFHVRHWLNSVAQRRLAILDPLKVIVENWPKGKVDHLEGINNPEDPSAGTRLLPFTGELWIERSDFMEDPPRKFHRLRPGGEVRLRYGYFLRCSEVVKDETTGEILELRGTIDPASRGGQAPDGRKVRGTIHWLSADYAVPATFRLYDTLFAKADPEDVPDGGDVLDNLNADSLIVTTGYVEESLAEAPAGTSIQLERTGYFVMDSDTQADHPVLNRTATLRDSWKNLQKRA